MARTIPALLCLLLVAACSRPCHLRCGSTTTRRADEPQHVLIRATRIDDTSADTPQVLIEAAVLSGRSDAMQRFTGAPTSGAFEAFVIELLSDGVRVLQMPSVVTADGEEAVIEIIEEEKAGMALALYAVPVVNGDRIAVKLNYSQVNPVHSAQARLDLPDRGAALVPAD